MSLVTSDHVTDISSVGIIVVVEIVMKYRNRLIIWDTWSRSWLRKEVAAAT